MITAGNKWSLTGLISLILFDLIASVAAVVGVYAYFSEAEDRALNRLATKALAKEMLIVRLDRNRGKLRSKTEISDTFTTLRELGVQTSTIDLSDLSFYGLNIKPFDTLSGNNVTVYQCKYRHIPGHVKGSIYLQLTNSKLLNCSIQFANLFAGDYSKPEAGTRRFQFSQGDITDTDIICGRDSEFRFEDIVLKNVRFKNCHKSQISMNRIAIENTDLTSLKNLEFTDSCVGNNVAYDPKFKAKRCKLIRLRRNQN